MKNNYKQFAESFAKKAGKVILANFKMGMKKEWKHDASPVTVTDKKINSMLIKEVRKFFPTHNVKGEEESYLKNTSDYLWVCDPVDGTIPFSHSIPICTFSLALVYKGQSILGVIFDPFMKNLYYAEKNTGTFLNGKKINVSDKNNLSSSIGNIEMWGRAKYNIANFSNEIIYKNKSIVFKLNSCIYPACLVAAGEIDFMVFPGITAHDIAAVKIIVEEAGGKVTDIYGKEQLYDRDINGAIVSNSKLHPELVKLSKKYIKLL